MSEERPAFHRLVIAEAIRFPELGRAMYEAGPRCSQAKLVVYLRDAMAAGRLREANRAAASEQFVELCLSGLYRSHLWNVASPPSEAEFNAHVDAALTTFMAAYGPQAAAFRL